MADTFASSNPFRRKTAADSKRLPEGAGSSSTRPPGAHTSGNMGSIADLTETELTSKSSSSKRVRVVSPHSSMIEQENSIQDRQPTPPVSQSGSPPSQSAAHAGGLASVESSPSDPFLSEAEEDSDVAGNDETQRNTRTNESISSTEKYASPGISANPFKVPRGSTGPLRRHSSISDRTASSPPTNGGDMKGQTGRASLDVDAFKRLIMTGNTAQSQTASPPQSSTRINTHVPSAADGGSSTDASSTSRQSVLEPQTETVLDTPRTSHEISASDEERLRWATGGTPSNSGKKRPPPPRTRHGKPIQSNAAQESFISPGAGVPESVPDSGASSKGETPQLVAPALPGSPTHLHKSLPGPSNPTTPESDMESDQAEKEAPNIKADVSNELTPSVASPSRRTKPALPLARRHSQRLPESPSLSRSNSAKSLQPVEGSNPVTRSFPVEGKVSNGRTLPPPPPPARRPTNEQSHSTSTISSLRHSQTSFPSAPPSHGSTTITKTQPTAPHPPLQRTSSTSSSNRSSRVPSILKSDDPAPGQPVMTSPPPPPPPRRHRGSSRSSLEQSSSSPAPQAHGTSREFEHTAGDSSRRSGTFTRTSLSEEPSSTAEAESFDVMADLSALQREVDELRGKYERKNVSG
ncbi:MAG: hypothetical protein M1837_006253 [Sclerophora amabilis]|nr:MAG: hypothetical protein M1837_006253 [Sclerophora amabilis]